MVNIPIDRLADEITNTIREYTEEVTDGIEQELNETSKQVLREIKAESPVLTGDYKRGWRRKKSSNGGQVTYTIYNKNKPSLTHLLELGHAKRGGGRVSGIPHIRPACDAYLPGLTTRIGAIIKNGGKKI